MVACNFHVLGNSRKYPYHTTESFFEFEEQGSGGGGAGVVFELEIQRHGGILTIGIPKAWGGGGWILNFYRRQTRVYSLKHLLSGLNQLTKKAQTGNTADNFGCRIQDKHQSLRYVFVFICRRKGTKYGS